MLQTNNKVIPIALELRQADPHLRNCNLDLIEARGQLLQVRCPAMNLKRKRPLNMSHGTFGFRISTWKKSGTQGFRIKN